MALTKVMLMLRQVAFLALHKPTLFKAVAQALATAALAEVDGDEAAYFADLDALYQREARITLESLGLSQPQPGNTAGAPTP